MKAGNSSDIIYKDVVIIGNGPSGISLSYMLQGNLPYLISDSHPDEMLSMRLSSAVEQCLIQQDLGHLAAGLEGRSTNPVSLLLDALLHPYADVGLEMEPLVEFRKTGVEIDHVVLGKGPPGGSWHKMDPYVLTLSLGSWMALPGLPFHSRDSGEKRAFAANVANYYVRYVQEMDLGRNFVNNAVVTSIKAINENVLPVSDRPQCVVEVAEDMPEDPTIPNYAPPSPERALVYKQPSSALCQGEIATDSVRYCLLSSTFQYLLLRSGRKFKGVRCKRSRESSLSQDQGSSPNRKLREFGTQPKPIIKRDKDCHSQVSFSCDSISSCDSSNVTMRHSASFDTAAPAASKSGPSALSRVPFKISPVQDCDPDRQSNWMVETHDVESGESTVYYCKYLVLANGASDSPNRLGVSRERRSADPAWLFHDLRSLECSLDEHLRQRSDVEVDPVLIVGAGLSAADAVIATRARNVPVVHVFRNKSADLNRQLPENMYPEYHKVHQMMQDGGSAYPYYTAYPEYNLADFDEASRSVILTSSSGETLKLEVSFVAVLIGSRPDFGFLPPGTHLGVRKDLPIDCKTNTVDIDKLTHAVDGCQNLFAIGPLAGDNFVRFIPGGALAVTTELYKRNNCICYP